MQSAIASDVKRTAGCREKGRYVPSFGDTSYLVAVYLRLWHKVSVKRSEKAVDGDDRCQLALVGEYE